MSAGIKTELLCDINMNEMGRDFLGKRTRSWYKIYSWMAADQLVILITDPYLRHCSLKNCRLPFVGIQYRIVVGIILKVVIIWNFKKVFIITKCITFVWKLVHTRFVVLFESIHCCGQVFL